MATEQRKHAAELKKTEALNTALQKFTYSPNGLTVPDLRALVISTTKASDAPVKKKKKSYNNNCIVSHEPRY